MADRSRLQEMAKKFAKDSIVADALGALIAQVLDAVNEIEVAPMRKRIEELESALKEIADGYTSEMYDRPLAFKMSRIARKALQK